MCSFGISWSANVCISAGRQLRGFAYLPCGPARISQAPRTFYTDIRLLQVSHIAQPHAPTRYVQALSKAGFTILIRPNLPIAGQGL